MVTHLSGTLVGRKEDGSARILAPKSEVLPGETLATAEDSYARVKFTDGGEVTLRPGTQLKIQEYTFQEGAPERDSALSGWPTQSGAPRRPIRDIWVPRRLRCSSCMSWWNAPRVQSSD